MRATRFAIPALLFLIVGLLPNPTLLAAATDPEPGSPCAEEPDRPWCDATMSPDERARLVLAELTQDEKFALMAGDPPDGHTGRNAGIDRLGVPIVDETDGPAGIRQGESTGLPAPLLLASSWDVDLAREYGQLIGVEARQKGNDIVLGPNVNILRIPTAGRTFEAYGEDPYLAGRMAVGWVDGLQSEGVMGDTKHYVANNQEINRGTVNVVVDDRTLRELYLPAFEATVTEADVATIMLAYNSVNGQFMTANGPLVNGVLRGEWGFDGFTISDYGFAVKSTAGSVNGGLDREMPYPLFYNPLALTAAVESGQVDMATIDASVLNQLRMMFEYGMFDRAPFPEDGEIDYDAHAVLAQRVTEQGTVLLRNEDALPLDLAGLSTIAVIGSAADAYHNGGGSSDVAPWRTVSALQGIQDYVGDAATVVYDDGSVASAAASTAAAADVALVVVADSQTEFLEKPCLTLSPPCVLNYGDQDGLVDAVAAAQPNTIVVLLSGGPVTMPWIDAVAGLIDAFYPGQEGGHAIARVLFGDVNPSGKLPATFPVSESDTLTAGDPTRYPGIAEQVEYSEGVFVGYRHYDEQGIDPLFEFGFGLSYTTFDYADLTVDAVGDGTATVSFDVTNTGDRAGAEIVQLYLAMPEPSADVPQPPRWLRAHDKVWLEPGETQRVTLTLDRRAFSYWDVTTDEWAIAPGDYEVQVGASSRDIRLAATVTQPPAAPEPPEVLSAGAATTPAPAPLPATGGGLLAAGLVAMLAVLLRPRGA